MDNKIDRKWLDGKVTITRKRLGEIMARETQIALAAARETGDKQLYGLVKELLTSFSASIGVEVFKELEDEEEEEDDTER